MDSLRRVATLKNTHAIWVVAPVHGEFERLVAVHRLLWDTFEPGDTLVYLGNMIGLGPLVRQSVDALLAFRRELIARPAVFANDLVYLRGAQEELFDKLLQIQFSPNPREVVEWMLRHGLETSLLAYGSSASELREVVNMPLSQVSRYATRLRESIRRLPGHAAFYASLKRAAVLDTGRLLFVHAGVDPYRPLAAQTDAFWWGHPAFPRMREPYAGFDRVIAGWHPEHRGVYEGAHYTLVDAGSGFGGPLLLGKFSTRGKLLELYEA